MTSGDIILWIRTGDRKRGLVFSLLIAALFISAVPAVMFEQKAFNDMELQKTRLKEAGLLRIEYVTLKERINSFEQRKALTKTEGIIQAAGSLISLPGIKDKVKSIKTAGNKMITNGTEERAEVRLERLSLNEMVNLLYRAENPAMMLSVRQVSIRKSFEKPDLLDLNMTLSLFMLK